MRIDTELNIPLDAELYKQCTNRIRNLEQENAHLKIQLKRMQDEKSCSFSVGKSPEIIDADRMSPLLRLGGYCSVESHKNRKHVICKILSNDKFETLTFAYYLTREVYDETEIQTMICVLAEMHRELINEMMSKVLNDKQVIANG